MNQLTRCIYRRIKTGGVLFFTGLSITFVLIFPFTKACADSSEDTVAVPSSNAQIVTSQAQIVPPQNGQENNNADIVFKQPDRKRKTKARDEVIDPDAPPSADKTGKRGLIDFGGRVSVNYDTKRNYDLDRKEADALGTVGPSIAVSTRITPHEKVSMFASMSLSRDIATIEKGEDKEKRSFELKLSQLNASFEDIPFKNLDFTVGRQRFKDDRQWVINETSDGFQVSYKYRKAIIRTGMFWEGILDSDLLNDEDDPRVDNYFVHTEFRVAKKYRISPYILLRRDHSPDQERMFFFGVHSHGKIIDNLVYWAEIGSSIGKERVEVDERDPVTGDDREVEKINRFAGIGFDVGAKYEFEKLPLKPALVAGYAFGNGRDDDTDEINSGFRQSGLQGNSDTLNGISTVSYYGELFDPELSNLMVITAGIATKPIKKASFEVLYHDYIQHWASTKVRGGSIDADPSGMHKRLGGELDFILAIRNIFNFDITGTVGMFVPDRKAYTEDADTIAFLAKVSTRYSF